MQTKPVKPITVDELKKIIGIKSHSEIMPDETPISSNVFNHLTTESSCSFFILTDYTRLKHLYISPGIALVMGYPVKMFECGGIEFMLSLLHPEEMDALRKIYHTVATFFNHLPAEDKLNYSYCHDVRMRRSNGEYIRLHCQLDMKELDADHGPYIGRETFTDITLFSTTPKMTLGIYCHSQNLFVSHSEYHFNCSFPYHMLTKREQEVVGFLQDGLTSKEIGLKLRLSKHTVDTYRRKIRKK